MRTIGVVSMKGGVGKTTLALSMAVNMARGLKRKGRVLVVDSDPQGNASMTLARGEGPGRPDP